MKKFLVKFEHITSDPYHFISEKILTEKEVTELNKKDKTLVLFTTPGSASYKTYTHEEFDNCLTIKQISEVEIKIVEEFKLLISNCDALEF